jgi:hypothetical protein
MLAGDRAIPAGNPAKVEVEVALHMLLVVGHLSLNTGIVRDIFVFFFS